MWVPGSDQHVQGPGAVGGPRGCWKLIWRQKRKMKTLKLREMLRRGVRVCTVWPQPRPPAHSSAPSASRGDASSSISTPGQGRGQWPGWDRATPHPWSQEPPLRLLRCCPPQDATTVTFPPSKTQICFVASPRAVGQCWGGLPSPSPASAWELVGCDRDTPPCTAVLEASGGFKVLAASSRDKRCHLGLRPLPTWYLQGGFGGSDLSFEDKQKMFCSQSAGHWVYPQPQTQAVAPMVTVAIPQPSAGALLAVPTGVPMHGTTSRAKTLVQSGCELCPGAQVKGLLTAVPCVRVTSAHGGVWSGLPIGILPWSPPGVILAHPSGLAQRRGPRNCGFSWCPCSSQGCCGQPRAPQGWLGAELGQCHPSEAASLLLILTSLSEPWPRQPPASPRDAGRLCAPRTGVETPPALQIPRTKPSFKVSRCFPGGSAAPGAPVEAGKHLTCARRKLLLTALSRRLTEEETAGFISKAPSSQYRKLRFALIWWQNQPGERRVPVPEGSR